MRADCGGCFSWALILKNSCFVCEEKGKERGKRPVVMKKVEQHGTKELNP
jgi:hypothetical protein